MMRIEPVNVLHWLAEHLLAFPATFPTVWGKLLEKPAQEGKLSQKTTQSTSEFIQREYGVVNTERGKEERERQTEGVLLSLSVCDVSLKNSLSLLVMGILDTYV